MLYASKKKGILVLLFVCLILTGCSYSSDSVERKASLPYDDMSDVKETPLEEEFLLKGSDKKSTSESIDIKKNIAIESDLDRLIIQHNLGNVSIYPSQSGKVEVKYYLLNPEKLSAEQKEYWKKTEINLKEKEGTLLVETLVPTGYSSNITDIFKEHGKMVLELALPSNIDELGLNTNLGNIKMEQIEATFLIHNNLGIIELDRVKPLGYSCLSTNLGLIEGSFADISELKELVNITNLGNIEISIPKDAEYIEMVGRDESAREKINEVIERLRQSCFIAFRLML